MRTVVLTAGLLVALAAMAGPAGAARIADWKLDEGAGQRVTDLSGRGHHGVLGTGPGVDAHDPAWVTGRFGGALRFDGEQDDFVTLGRPQGLLVPRVTVAAWVRRLGSPGRWRYVFSSGASECHAAPYGLYSGVGGGMAFYVSDLSGYVVSPAAPPEAVWDGQWHRAVGTFDGHAVRLYLDGVEVGSGTPTSLSIAYGERAAGTFIGTYHGSCAIPFTGDIDEVVVRDRGATAEEIAAEEEQARTRPLPLQPPPVSGPPAGASADSCLSVAVKPRRIRSRRRSRLRIAIKRDGLPAAATRVLLRGPGVRKRVRVGADGRKRVRVRAKRAGRLTVKPIGQPRHCRGKTVRVLKKRR